MPKLKDQIEINAYYLNDPAHPRAAGVMWPTLVERRIDQLFEIGFRPDKKVHNELFQPSGALGSYAVKVRLAYMLGWFQKDFYEDLLLISKIRNRFAHEIEVKDFSESHIFSWLRNMKAYQLLPEMLERAKKRAEDERGKPQPPQISGKSSKVSAAGYYHILKDTYEDPQSAFRFCIDMMLHQLDKCEDNMKKNLANLCENWMTADPGSEGMAHGKQPSSKKS
ncbi:MAG: hypothetical protein C75L2_00020044 [Leptospirillum sp. Group II 'C75']|jgi:hypothetical protein|uniref:MltR family transcriptional regulator n=1 Tax=Leptospirillum sp. Group II 'CF-1' TaxID=1660083 RepID=UPI00029CB7FE|nr:MltR family transcriptional regulator [Leptospirillum sp. Group II 'CF-1']AKS22863.1 hypothetical protein ABH19_02505 [Leptospirillum sp. Group II 'CF-1']EIJ75146.1 MAG: hypothetical protein C75L2_00020044 [Leptospirillum sp. Group II 'C75']